MIIMKPVLKILSLAILLVSVAISASAVRPPIPEISLSPKSLSFSADGGSISFSVAAEDISWGIVTAPAAWVKASKSDDSLNITVLKNTSDSSRSTSITLGEGKTTCNVTIMQKEASTSPETNAGDENSKNSGQDNGNAVETFTVKGVKFEMVRVDGGSFMMGSDDKDAYDSEKPVHRETVSTFYIGRTEVTQALWEAVMGRNPSLYKGANLPVENVSWYDCQEFIRKLNQLTGRNFRLPSEAEWEYAARGANLSQGYKYSGSNNLGSVGWYVDNSRNKTHPVTKQANELGLYDMSGNVYEWTSDKWSSNYESTRNGGPSGSDRVVRGGNYGCFATYCRSAYRNHNAPGNRYSGLGLRLAL